MSEHHTYRIDYDSERMTGAFYLSATEDQADTIAQLAGILHQAHQDHGIDGDYQMLSITHIPGLRLHTEPGMKIRIWEGGTSDPAL